ncbi:hypothetical protein BGZ75_006253, partial [Mortierella antarctica]
MGNDIKHITDASFDVDVLQSGAPVLLDFWAPWCGPCKMVSKVLDDVSDEYGERLQIAKINIDEHQLIPAKFG